MIKGERPFFTSTEGSKEETSVLLRTKGKKRKCPGTREKGEDDGSRHFSKGGGTGGSLTKTFGRRGEGRLTHGGEVEREGTSIQGPSGS